jgi:hypothetical protein
MSLRQLQSIGTDIWLAEDPSVSFLGFPYPTRMAIVRLPEAPGLAKRRPALREGFSWLGV